MRRKTGGCRGDGTAAVKTGGSGRCGVMGGGFGVNGGGSGVKSGGSGVKSGGSGVNDGSGEDSSFDDVVNAEQQ